jgi:hypothetical protein
MADMMMRLMSETRGGRCNDEAPLLCRTKFMAYYYYYYYY